MEIIIQGHKVETKEIYDIVDISSSRVAGFIIKLVDKEDIRIAKGIPYERTPNEICREQEPYDRLRKEIIAKWESDKSDLPIFKL